MKSLKEACKRIPVYKPRLEHLKAYMCAIRNQHGDAESHIKKGVTEAKAHKNILELEWLNHSKMVWYDSKHNMFQESFWMMNTEDELVDWHAARFKNEEERTLIKYSLPLPFWYDYD